jgi:putative hydrolase of the HAD superfamily
LIFDFGNVLAFFDYGIAAAGLGKRLGLSGEQVMRRAEESGVRDAARAFECGAIHSEEFHRAFCERTGFTIDFPTFKAVWADIFRINEPVAALAIRLARDGHRLILGSNTNPLHAAHWRANYPHVLDAFTHRVYSYEVGAMKPDARFYETCLRHADRPSGQCLFIDDLEENVAGARACGLVGLQYLGMPELVRSLRSMGIALPDSD